MMASYTVSELEAIADVDGHLWEARRISEAVMIKRADVWKGGKSRGGLESRKRLAWRE
jgi:hypothetical protein